MSVEVSFGLLGLAILAAAAYGVYRYNTPLNPLTLFVISQMGLFTLLSGVVAYVLLPLATYSEADLVYTSEVSLVYLLGATIPYFFRGNLAAKIFGRGVRSLGLASETVGTRFSPAKFVLLLLGALAAFVALMVSGGGGLMWITDTRAAYITYRSSAGPFFAATQWFLTFALLYYLWSRKPQGMKLVLMVLFFCGLASFTGSKNNILTMIVVAVAHHHFRVRRIRTIVLIALVPAMLLCALALLVIGGSFNSLAESIVYFQDYFGTTADFFSRFHYGDFDYLYGRGWLSSLWFLVPRQLYPDKPYEYGITLIHGVLFPGAAATGNTPGILGWSLSYLDFGVFGVLLDGIIGGIWMRMAYEHFIRNRKSFFAFVLMMQFALWPIWTFAPTLLVVFISLGQCLFLRLVHRRQAPTLAAQTPA